ncbi:MAG: helix-turn-helix domain-containing protein [Thermoplasmata archaeon]
MRKLTVRLSLNDEMKKMIEPVLKYVESYKILEIVRLDFQEGIKVMIVSFKLRENFDLEDVEPPQFLEILSVLKQEGNEYFVLLKVDVPDSYMFMMHEYGDQLTKDIIWDTPMYVDGDEGVLSCIGEQEELGMFLDMIESVGEIKKIKFTKATYDSKDLISTLTDKQKEVVELAKRKGYYDYPRGITLDELSKELNISKSKTSEHLRKAEQRLMSEILAAV